MTMMPIKSYDADSTTNSASIRTRRISRTTVLMLVAISSSKTSGTKQTESLWRRKQRQDPQSMTRAINLPKKYVTHNLIILEYNIIRL